MGANTYGPEVEFDLPGGGDPARAVQEAADVDLRETQRYIGNSDLVTDELDEAVREAIRESTFGTLDPTGPMDLLSISRDASRTEIRVRFPEPEEEVQRKASRGPTPAMSEVEDEEDGDETTD